MGIRRHRQEGALVPPLEMLLSVFCALVVTAKCSVDKLLMHYFHNLSASAGFSPIPQQDQSLDPAEGLSFPDPLICPTLEKILRAPMQLCVMFSVCVFVCFYN